jgi:hypothetical protein
MILRRLAPLAMVALLAAPSAFAQSDDDFLVPLTDAKPGASKSKKTTKVPPKKRTAAKPPKKPAKKATAKRGTGSKTPVAEQTPAPEDDGLGVVPLVESKTELLVKLGGAVKGARLSIDNQDMGPLPVPAQEIAPGEHTIVVKRPGFSEFNRRITVEPGRVNEVVATLDAVAGVVAVNVDVPGASIAIDGDSRGVAPLTGVLLKPGSHVIEARRDGFEAEPKTIGVRAGRDYSVDFHMRPTAGGAKTPVASVDRPAAPVLTPKVQPELPKVDEPDTAAVALGPDMETHDEVAPSTPLTKRWYFWAGVGAVVAGAVVGTVAMTQNSPAKPLTLEDVCGAGGCDGQINAPTGAGIVRF